jgi:DNA-3-methyladenine glycosylase II
VFEAVVNAFACQQLSLVVGLELLNRLAAVCDVRRGTGANARYGFPTPDDVARHPPAAYRTIGFSRQKVDALLNLARGIRDGHIAVEGLAGDDDLEVRARLSELRGVGRWTAEYVLLRGLGRLHVFPGDDVGAQKSLARWLGRRAPLDYTGVRMAVEKWQPYAGMVYFHLLLDGLSRTGVLESVG